MTAVISDPNLEDHVIADRRARGLDRWDEVWDGTYMIMPLPNDEHQEIAGGIAGVLTVEIQLKGLGLVRPGVNVTDREDDWEENFRCPDVVVFLPDTHAVNRDTNWLGGPEFAVEVASSGDQTRGKFAFYESVNVRELLIVDRKPWRLELHRLVDGLLTLAGTSDLQNAAVVASEQIPFQFQLVRGQKRPAIRMVHATTGQEWLI